MTELEAVLGERAADVTREETDLAAFGIRYRQEAGLLHEKLDELDRKIAEPELGELSKSFGESVRLDSASVLGH